MDRTATATIEGFNYQHNKSILEILKAKPNTQITLEGLIEDIDIKIDNNIIAIQCKYYESKKDISASTIAKAIFDMLVNHLENPNINFKLYIHVEGKSEEKEVDFNIDFLNEILKTNDKKYIKKYFPLIYKFPKEVNDLFNKKKLEEQDLKIIKTYIKNHEDTILMFNKQTFINKVTLISAVKNEDLKKSIIEMIVNNGNDIVEAENIIYPNFFQYVAEISSNKDLKKRCILVSKFKREILDKKELIYTKWLAKIYDKQKYKKEIKKRLRTRLSGNSSFRVLIINAKNYNSNEIAVFIKEYNEKFCRKLKLNYLPLIMIKDENEEKFLSLQSILYSSYNILVETGEVARKININKLFTNYKGNIKLCMHNFEIDKYLLGPNIINPDDIIVIGEFDSSFYEKQSIPITKIEGLNIEDILYVFDLGGK